MHLAPVTRVDVEVDDTIDLVNQMVRQSQSGDGDAFESVYRAHVGRIHALDVPPPAVPLAMLDLQPFVVPGAEGS
jgi:hypothetical protein